MEFNTDIFRPTVREETKLTSFRVGATLRPLPDQTAIFSAIVADSEDSFSEEPGEVRRRTSPTINRWSTRIPAHRRDRLGDTELGGGIARIEPTSVK